MESFLENSKIENSYFFAKKVLLSNEVQSNNSVEVYYDDIQKIKRIVTEKNLYKNTKGRICSNNNYFEIALNYKFIDDETAKIKHLKYNKKI